MRAAGAACAARGPGRGALPAASLWGTARAAPAHPRPPAGPAPPRRSPAPPACLPSCAQDKAGHSFRAAQTDGYSCHALQLLSRSVWSGQCAAVRVSFKEELGSEICACPQPDTFWLSILGEGKRFLASARCAVRGAAMHQARSRHPPRRRAKEREVEARAAPRFGVRGRPACCMRARVWVGRTWGSVCRRIPRLQGCQQFTGTAIRNLGVWQQPETHSERRLASRQAHERHGSPTLRAIVEASQASATASYRAVRQGLYTAQCSGRNALRRWSKFPATPAVRIQAKAPPPTALFTMGVAIYGAGLHFPDGARHAAQQPRSAASWACCRA